MPLNIVKEKKTFDLNKEDIILLDKRTTVTERVSMSPKSLGMEILLAKVVALNLFA